MFNDCVMYNGPMDPKWEISQQPGVPSYPSVFSDSEPENCAAFARAEPQIDTLLVPVVSVQRRATAPGPSTSPGPSNLDNFVCRRVSARVCVSRRASNTDNLTLDTLVSLCPRVT